MFNLDKWVIRRLKPIMPIYRYELRREATRQPILDTIVPARVQTTAKRLFQYLVMLLVVLGISFVLLYARATGGTENIIILVVQIAGALLCTGALLAPFALLLVFIIPRVRITTLTSDAIAREVEAGTWDLLRVTPWSIQELVYTKYAVALAQTRRLMTPIYAVRGFISVMLFFSAAEAIDDEPLLAITLLLFAFFFVVIDSQIDFLTDAALGLLASAFGRTRAQALTAAFILSPLNLGMQYMLGLLLLMNLYEAGEGICIMTLFIITATRYAVLRGLLALAIWRAERL